MRSKILQDFYTELKFSDIISDLLKKYSKWFTQEELTLIQQEVPRSYIPWIFKQYEAMIKSIDRIKNTNPNLARNSYIQAKFTFLEDIPNYLQYLKEFENHKQDLRTKGYSADINDYSIESLKNLINSEYQSNVKYTKYVDINELKQNIPIAYEDENWIIFTPQTEEQACEVGKGTDWCTTRDSFNTYFSNGPIYNLINKNDNRRWQYDKFSGMFFTEDDNDIDIENFLIKYENQLTQDLFLFLTQTSGNLSFLYSDTDSPEFIASQDFDPDANHPSELPYYLYNSYPLFQEKGDTAYKNFVLTALSVADLSVETIQEYYLLLKNTPEQERKKYQTLEPLEFILSLLDALP